MQVSQVATAEQVIQFATTHAAQVAALGLFPAAQVVQAVALVQVVQSALRVVHATQVLASPIAPAL